LRRPGTLRLAHRGDWRRAPENTIEAFRAAIAVPACDGIELDVRLSSDGVPVILHDPTLARVQGRPDRVDAVRSTVLADLGVPTLAEALLAAGRGAFLDIELKVDTGLAAFEVLAAGRGPELRNAVVSSFDRVALQGIGRRAPIWPRWLNSPILDSRVVAEAVALGCRGVSVDWLALDGPSIDTAREAGLEVAAFTVRRRSTFDRLARLGVVAVCVEGAALDG